MYIHIYRMSQNTRKKKLNNCRHAGIANSGPVLTKTEIFDVKILVCSD